MDNVSEPQDEPEQEHRETAKPSATLASGLLAALAMAVLAGLIAWILLQIFFPVFKVPEELSNVQPTSPPELQEKLNIAVWVAQRNNTMLAMGIVGLLAGGLLALGEACSRSSFKFAPLASLLGALIGGLGGAATGMLGLVLFAALQSMHQYSPMTRTIAMHSAMLCALGAAIGLGMSLGYRRVRLVVHCVLGCVLGGIFAAVIYPALMGVLMPIEQTDIVLPNSGPSRMVWLLFTLGMMALVVTGLGKKKGKPAAAAESDQADDAAPATND